MRTSNILREPSGLLRQVLQLRHRVYRQRPLTRSHETSQKWTGQNSRKDHGNVWGSQLCKTIGDQFLYRGVEQRNSIRQSGCGSQLCLGRCMSRTCKTGQHPLPRTFKWTLWTYHKSGEEWIVEWCRGEYSSENKGRPSTQQPQQGVRHRHGQRTQVQ